MYSHELHLQLDKDQGKVRNDAVKLKKESEKARKALCKENEKKRKENQKLFEITTSLAHEDEFNGQIFKIQRKYLFFVHLALIKFLRSCIPDLSI